jgi:DNA-directed RNA polymerase I, II, and III subunit RPABC2
MTKYFDDDDEINSVKSGGSSLDDDSVSIVEEEEAEGIDEVEEEEPIEEEEEEPIEEEEEEPIEENEEEITKKDKGQKKSIPANKTSYKNKYLEEDEEDEDEEGEQYLQKFDKSINQNYILDYHPECVTHNYDEIISMTTVVRDKNGIIIDDLHRTFPFLTKYEKARIIGQRAKQINSGAPVFVKVPESVIDGDLIAELELKEKRIPFIIRRPLPNGGSEYWKLKDLENIDL